MTKKARRRIDAGLKAKIALQTLREQATVVGLAQRYEVCEPEVRPAADASDGDRGVRAEAENEQARARPQDLSLSPAQSDDVDALAETIIVPEVGRRLRCSGVRREAD